MTTSALARPRDVVVRARLDALGSEEAAAVGYVGRLEGEVQR